MSKAILIFDMPESCIQCLCFRRGLWGRWCAAMKSCSEKIPYESKHENCPLIEAPEGTEVKVVSKYEESR